MDSKRDSSFREAGDKIFVEQEKMFNIFQEIDQEVEKIIMNITAVYAGFLMLKQKSNLTDLVRNS